VNVAESKPRSRPDTSWRWCRLRPCPGFRGPFQTSAALGSHKARTHGLAGIAHKQHRPEGGKLLCKYGPGQPHESNPPCLAKPYVTEGGRGYHYRNAHGEESTDPQSVARRSRRRAVAAAKAEKQQRQGGKTRKMPPPPASPATDTHTGGRATLSPSVRLALTAVALRTVDTWSVFFRRPAALIRAEAVVALAENLAPRKPSPRSHARAGLDAAEREHLRRRLLYAINGTWARAFNLTPSAVRDAVLAMLQ